MMLHNRSKRMLISLVCLGAGCGVSVQTAVMAGTTKTIIRSDYNKNDYVLFMTTVAKKGEAKPGETNDDIETQSGSVVARQGLSWEIPNGSGSPGDASVEINIGKNVTLPNPKEYYAVTGIRIDERNNQPCVLTLIGAVVDPVYQSDATREVARHALARCTKVLPGKDSKQVDLSEDLGHFDANTHGKVFVSGISVCRGKGVLQPMLHSAQWEIKGIRVQPTEVKLQDSPVREADLLVRPDVKQFTRANCRKKVQATEAKSGWDNWSDCPVGQVVTGVRAYYAKDKYFTGLVVNCKSVESRRITRVLVKDAHGY